MDLSHIVLTTFLLIFEYTNEKDHNYGQSSSATFSLILKKIQSLYPKLLHKNSAQVTINI